MKDFNPEKKDCSIVLIGKFNPEMFTPDWFLKHQIIREEDAVFANNQKDNYPNYPFIISNQLTMFMTNNISLRVEPNRFTVSANREPFLEIKDFVVNTFNKLGALEITAFGINYSAHYHIDSPHEYQLIGDRLAPKNYWKELLGDEVSGDDRHSGLTSIRVAKSTENNSLTIELQPSIHVKYGVYIRANDHHVVEKDDNDAETVATEIESIFENRIEKMKFLQENLLDEVLKDEE